MKILIAIGGIDFSKPTLNMGIEIASALEASSTIAYVGKKISQFSEKDVSVVHQSLDNRQLYRPGIRTLEWACNFLETKGYLDSDSSANFDDHLLIDEDNSRMKVLLKSNNSNNIDLILRTGEIIDQLRDEVFSNGHDITVVGGGKNKGIYHDLIEFIHSSILVVKNFSFNKKYKILLPINNTKGSKKATDMAIRLAQHYKTEIHIVYVKDKKEQDVVKSIETTSNQLSKLKIKNETFLLEGEPVKSITEFAKDDYIISLGVSNKNPIKNFFFGSKPISISKQCNCPVLLVK